MELPAHIQGLLAQHQDLFRRDITGLRWTRADLLHITLRFMGNVNADTLSSVRLAVDQAVSQHHPFTVGLGGLGAFPSVARPRVIWAGVQTGAQSLIAVRASLDLALVRAGFPVGGATYAPHVTLARLRRNWTREQQRVIAGRLQSALRDTPIPAPWTVHAVVVMKSVLTRHGPAYTPLHAARLPG